MITIKKIGIESIELLQEISIRTFSNTFGKDNNPNDLNEYLSKAYSKQQLSSELKNPHSEFYFILLDKKLAGYLKINIEDAQTENIIQNGMEIERIYVDSDFKRNGLGNKLYGLTLTRAKELKKNTLWLGVWEKNLSAIEFYKKMGFTFISQHSFFVGGDEQTDLIMKKDIRTQ